MNEKQLEERNDKRIKRFYWLLILIVCTTLILIIYTTWISAVNVNYFSGLTAFQSFIAIIAIFSFIGLHQLSKTFDKNSLIYGCHGIALVVFLTWGMCTWFLYTIEQAILPASDVSQYQSYLDESTSHGCPDLLVSHFPRTIPEEAKDIHVRYKSPIMQSGGYLQLRYSLPPQTIQQLHTQYTNEKMRHSFVGGSWGDHKINGITIPTTQFFTSDSKNNSFPKNYEIMVFDIREGDEQIINESITYNWEDSHGVAISKQRNEIIYWAEWGA